MEKNINIKKSDKVLLAASFFFLLIGVLSGFCSKKSSEKPIDIIEFSQNLHSIQKKTFSVLIDLKLFLERSNSTDSLIYYPFEDKNVFYYVFEGEKLEFWSDNHLDIGGKSPELLAENNYLKLTNAHCVSLSIPFHSKTIIALIVLKYDYPFENKSLKNYFHPSLRIDKQIAVAKGTPHDPNAVFSLEDQYLFSLEEPSATLYNKTWAYTGYFCYLLFFLLLFFLYANFPRYLKGKTCDFSFFAILSLTVFFVLALLMHNNLPDMLFNNPMVSAVHYSANRILSSFTHLTILSGFIFATIYLFFRYVDTSRNNTWYWKLLFQLFFFFYFLLVYYLLHSIVFHSSIQIGVLRFQDITLYTLWVHLLILIWGVGFILLFFKAYNWLNTQKDYLLSFSIMLFLSIGIFFIAKLNPSLNAMQFSFSYLAVCLVYMWAYANLKKMNLNFLIFICVAVVAGIGVWNIFSFEKIKREVQYETLARNLNVYGNSDDDRIMELLLESLDDGIKNDTAIVTMLKESYHEELKSYINMHYLTNFFNKYDVIIQTTLPFSVSYNQFNELIEDYGTQIRKSNFYYIPQTSDHFYLGHFDFEILDDEVIHLFLQLKPTSTFTSFSFPDLLITQEPSIRGRLQIATSIYENNHLVSSLGGYAYPSTVFWIPKNNERWSKITFRNNVHYVYRPNDTLCYVITELQSYNPVNYLVYFIYLSLLYYSLCWITFWTFSILNKKKKYKLNLITKFQYLFFGLFVVSFIGIISVAGRFLRKEYQEEQIQNIESKKKYIQKALQDMYYWNVDLTKEDSYSLSFTLQDLSYTYQTDIHVYSNSGRLIASSQPVLFSKKLISDLIPPFPYFTEGVNITQDEHIGKLSYLSSYIDFYNGDYLQIGFIAIPQFYSEEEIRSSIEQFLLFILHIYVAVIAIAILLSIFIGRQLMHPLNMMQKKLQEMRLGKRNEKIDYKYNDEVSELVKQYNQTVDELERSAELLAKSERESAWKTMARQIAHEINNPLTPMKLSLQHLKRTKQMDGERFDEYFESSSTTLIEQIDNLSRIARSFSDFAKMPEAKYEKVDLATKLYSVVQLFINNESEVSIRHEGLKEDVFVIADPEELIQLFNNLIKNAIEAILEDRKGLIQVMLEKTTDDVIVRIIDNGKGITDDVAKKLFMPSFTTKTSGMGLGLAICKNIVEHSGGKIEFHSKVNIGSTFVVTLPLAQGKTGK